ncbi:hypothetical protein ACIBQ0_05245 [Nocardia nova]|uniref:hypothetical protein n=1 Tax=Nocardia nova TaxID=37330 RepID=UPI0037882E2A
MDTPAIDPLAGLDGVPWHRLYTTHGRAAFVPEWLRAIRDNRPFEEIRLGPRPWELVHQGTPGQVAAHVVPFLVALADDRAVLRRTWLVDLLREIAFGGHWDDRDLPFEPPQAWTNPVPVDEARMTAAVDRMFREDELDDDDLELVDIAAVRWAAEGYRAVASHTEAYTRWVLDPDPVFAASSAGLIVWFPIDGAAVAALMAVSSDLPHAEARASANLALAHVSDTDLRIDHCLISQLTSHNPLICLTAAIAVAYRRGEDLPDTALRALIDARGEEHLHDVAGWERSLTGFVARAIHRLGLGWP